MRYQTLFLTLRSICLWRCSWEESSKQFYMHCRNTVFFLVGEPKCRFFFSVFLLENVSVECESPHLLEINGFSLTLAKQKCFLVMRRYCRKWRAMYAMMHEVHPSVLESARCFVWSCKNSLMILCCSQRKFYSNPRFFSARSCLFTDLLCCYTNVCGANWCHAQTQCRHQNYIFLGEFLFRLSKISFYFVVWEIKCSRFPFSKILILLSFKYLA